MFHSCPAVPEHPGGGRLCLCDERPGRNPSGPGLAQRPVFSWVHSRFCSRMMSGGSGLSRNSVFITGSGG
ncbi:Uncharacterised protein [Chromobacterium vaccinii]|nr:Uncharacterised protein [Chromobacterium vaccinii]